MKPAVLVQEKKVQIEELPPPVPLADEVLVRIKACGVCGSDVHFYHEGRVGTILVEAPLVLGHEAAGEVVELGAGVSGWQMGDRVAIEPGVQCRRCAYCKGGEYNHCRHSTFQSAPGADGFFAEYAAIATDRVFRLPDSLSYEEGALIEPWAVALQAAQEGAIGPGQVVAVFGCGPIGLLCLQAAAVRGAGSIVAIDLEERRLRLAAELGATHTVNARASSPAEVIASITGGLGADVALEASGAVPALQQCLAAVRPGGTVVAVGNFSETTFPVDMMRVVLKGLKVHGVFRYANQFAQGAAMAAAGRVNLGALISHRFPLDRAQEALEFSMRRKDVAIKCVVTI
ncbi:MAG: NAD(P)-dependent alcohol dehydrogenase [Dehalococcoidales bacterium]|nr:NAD(P)-dependent alcohol dehydrogenase [Dehalococcoidales bacterium]